MIYQVTDIAKYIIKEDKIYQNHFILEFYYHKKELIFLKDMEVEALNLLISWVGVLTSD